MVSSARDIEYHEKHVSALDNEDKMQICDRVPANIKAGHYRLENG